MFRRRRAILESILCCAWLSLPAAAGAVQVNSVDPNAPSVMEEALIEHRCNASPTAGRPESDTYEQCLSAQLAALRANFGRDLSGLPADARTAIDAACARLAQAPGREGYVRCIDQQLAPIEAARRRANPAAAPAATQPGAVAVIPQASPQATGSVVLWIGGAIGIVALVAGGVAMAKKTRQAPTPSPPQQRQCRTCGRTLAANSGDLCPECRHEAAESLRRAARERAEGRQAQMEQQIRHLERVEETRRQQLAQQTAPPVEAPAPPTAQAPPVASPSPPTSVLHPIGAELEPKDELFDPYAVLGVTQGADRAAIVNAYQAARAKYDANQVSHLGLELQAHYKAKAEAVERAYQELSAAAGRNDRA